MGVVDGNILSRVFRPFCFTIPMSGFGYHNSGFTLFCTVDTVQADLILTSADQEDSSSYKGKELVELGNFSVT